MKTMFQTLILLLFVSSICKAQPTSGTIFVGGDAELSINKYKTKDDNTTTENFSRTNYSFLPQAGYFLSDIIAVGARIGVNGNITKSDDYYSFDKRTTNYVVLNPFARYYIINQKGGLFAEADMSFNFGKTKTSYANTSTNQKSTSIFIGLQPGVYYYITDRIALQAYYGWFGYQTYIDKDENGTKDINSSMGFDISTNSFAFGFVYDF